MKCCQKNQVKIKAEPGYEPVRATEGAVGFDLKAYIPNDEVLEIRPGERKLVRTSVFIELPPNLHAEIRPRSGLALKNGITVLNTPGTIDPDYKGEIQVILINHGDSTFFIADKMRIAQMVIMPFWPGLLDLVDDISYDSKRGAGGMGSTGV